MRDAEGRIRRHALDLARAFRGTDPNDFASYTVGPFLPGRYELTATASDGRTRTRKVTVRGEPEKGVTIRLRD